ncbi:MAG: IS1595 family transposase [Nitrospirota bacterium]|nr:IS1595 family transposase [Nitrospirota bacterium]
MTKPTMTLAALMTRFSTEEACKEFLIQQRWPNGVECPRCHNKKVYALKSKPFHWVCKGKDCGERNGYRFSVISKTIFENTNYPLRIWFQVIYLMTQSKKGISALQIHRQIGSGDYRTAWYMCHRVRAAMRDSGFAKLIGEVEVDETYIGGKDKNRHWDKKEHVKGGSAKMTVIGAIARKGNVVCQVIENADRLTMCNFVRQTVGDAVSLVATDEAAGYATLKNTLPHESVNHGKKEYVRGNVHTNNLEAFWSLLKRGVIGTFHQVSKDYLPLYLAEFSFRHNNRKNADIFTQVVAGC